MRSHFLREQDAIRSERGPKPMPECFLRDRGAGTRQRSLVSHSRAVYPEADRTRGNDAKALVAQHARNLPVTKIHSVRTAFQRLQQ